ncbi:MAG: hypothetical protein D6680_10805 [Cyanobacteria bacterium J007]|jgi:hypothetical protein|nr:MAG: hypothetical protein D6680_10805 [Cyanobacteria bacterium J007]
MLLQSCPIQFVNFKILAALGIFPEKKLEIAAIAPGAILKRFQFFESVLLVILARHRDRRRLSPNAIAARVRAIPSLKAATFPDNSG